MQVWKFRIPYPDGEPQIRMPEGARVLHVGEQDNEPTLWALVTPDNKMVERKFQFRGTGHDVYDVPPEGVTYLGTCFIGPFVWHLFE